MKKQLLFLLFASIIFSCQEKSSENMEQSNILEKLSFTVDTILVDSGDELLNLGFGIRTFDLNDNSFFFFENSPPALVEVDLEAMTLTQKTEFETEGPDGVGNFVAQVSIGPNEEVYVLGVPQIGIYDKSGKKQKNLKVTPKGIDSQLAENFFSLYGNSIYDFKRNLFYSWPTGEEINNPELVIIDVKNQTARTVALPEMEIVRKYTLLANENGNYMSSGQPVYLFNHQNKLLISTSAMGDFYEYDPDADSLRLIKVTHQMIPNRLSGEVTQNLTTEKAFRQEMAKINSQIIYQKLMWDSKKNLFFRLASQVKMGETRNDPNEYTYYLLAYNKDYELVGESKLNGVTDFIRGYFFKDGKLWSYVNVNDELGFAVMDFKF
ncbi:DUF4221 family protein [Algoriphagus algorifonticola]|uniref:DUF4221 family protein n=1 Tax=Algoriphagus algorifonticola TaxID=2593007 RepID=UPI0011A59C51|nr:DUF4221 family protein [Algoriphagus algorifonticola]